MEKRLLNSIIALTEHQNIDSLEVSLLSTIIGYVPCRKLSIIELNQHHGFSEAFINLELACGELDADLTWQTNLLLKEPPQQLVQCVTHNQEIQVPDGNGGTEYWLPIEVQEKQLCLYALTSRLSEQEHSLVQAFTQIYRNYLKVLLESEKDKLTGLLNRHSFERRLKHMLIKQHEVQKQQIAEYPNRKQHETDYPHLAIIDIDHFKKVNDRFGHICGDEVLLALTQRMTRFFRATDFVFRFGGEEFVIIMAPLKRQDAKQKLEQFRLSIAQDNFPLVGKITVSIGFAAMTERVFEQLIMEHADKALYYAKDHGRNAVFSYEELSEQNELSDSTSSQTDDTIDIF